MTGGALRGRPTLRRLTADVCWMGGMVWDVLGLIGAGRRMMIVLRMVVMLLGVG